MKDEVLWRLDFSVSNSSYARMFNIEADFLAGCRDLLNNAILLSCKQFIDGFIISGLGMFNYRPKLNGAACQIATSTLLFREPQAKII